MIAAPPGPWSSLTVGDLGDAIVWLITLLGALFVTLKWVRPSWKRHTRMLDALEPLERNPELLCDLVGRPERPGVEAQPGVMERLKSIDTSLSTVTGEVTHNGGASIKDSVTRMEQRQRQMQEQLDQLAVPRPDPQQVRAVAEQWRERAQRAAAAGRGHDPQTRMLLEACARELEQVLDEEA